MTNSGVRVIPVTSRRKWYGWSEGLDPKHIVSVRNGEFLTRVVS